MKILVNEKLSQNRYIDNSGFLICTNAILARTGKQQYRKNELWLDTDDCSIIDIDRPFEEVFDEKTLASFENKPLTIEHPDQNVDTENFKQLAVGYIRDVKQGKVGNEDVIMGTVVITNQDAIDLVQSGQMTDLSCGYDCDIIQDDNGNYYQHCIRGNHVALCREGRAGIARLQDSTKVKDDSRIIKEDDAITKEFLNEANRLFKDKFIHKPKPYAFSDEGVYISYQLADTNYKDGKAMFTSLLDNLKAKYKKFKYKVTAKQLGDKEIKRNDCNVSVTLISFEDNSFKANSQKYGIGTEWTSASKHGDWVHYHYTILKYDKSTQVYTVETVIDEKEKHLQKMTEQEVDRRMTKASDHPVVIIKLVKPKDSKVKDGKIEEAKQLLESNGIKVVKMTGAEGNFYLFIEDKTKAKLAKELLSKKYDNVDIYRDGSTGLTKLRVGNGAETKFSKAEVEKAIDNLGYKVTRWYEYSGDLVAVIRPDEINMDGYEWFRKQVRKLAKYGKDVYTDDNEIIFYQPRFKDSKANDSAKAKFVNEFVKNNKKLYKDTALAISVALTRWKKLQKDTTLYDGKLITDKALIDKLNKCFKVQNKNRVSFVLYNDVAYATIDGINWYDCVERTIPEFNQGRTQEHRVFRCANSQFDTTIAFSRLVYGTIFKVDLGNREIDHLDGNHMNDDPNNYELISGKENLLRNQARIEARAQMKNEGAVSRSDIAKKYGVSILNVLTKYNGYDKFLFVDSLKDYKANDSVWHNDYQLWYVDRHCEWHIIGYSDSIEALKKQMKQTADNMSGAPGMKMKITNRAGQEIKDSKVNDVDFSTALDNIVKEVANSTGKMQDAIDKVMKELSNRGARLRLDVIEERIKASARRQGFRLK